MTETQKREITYEECYIKSLPLAGLVTFIKTFCQYPIFVALGIVN